MTKKRQLRKRPDTTSYQEKVDALGKLEEFSAEAFRPDENYPVELCRLVFSLAVIHNDFNDIDLALTLLNVAKPSDDGKIDRRWGMFSGISLHLAKAKISVVHELLKLIRENAKVLEGKPFKELLKKLSHDQREAWQEVADAAGEKSHDTAMGRYLAKCRDKAHGHYDAKVLYSAYEASIAENLTNPIISRGNCLLEMRFFFADKAIEKIVLHGDTASAKELLFTDANLLSSINLSIYVLVTRFINARYAFKQIVEGSELGPAALAMRYLFSEAKT